MFSLSIICSREISDKIVCRRFQPSLYRPPAPRFMCIIYSYIVFPHQQHLISFSYRHRTFASLWAKNIFEYWAQNPGKQDSYKKSLIFNDNWVAIKDSWNSIFSEYSAYPHTPLYCILFPIILYTLSHYIVYSSPLL